MGTGQAFSTRIDARNGVASIALIGELDLAGVPLLNDKLTALEQDGTKAIVIDLRDLRFIDSSGLHALVAAHKRSEMNGHRLMLIGANPFTRRLCEITGTEFLLDAQGTAELLGRFTGDGSRVRQQDGEVGVEPHG